MIGLSENLYAGWEAPDRQPSPFTFHRVHRPFIGHFPPMRSRINPLVVTTASTNVFEQVRPFIVSPSDFVRRSTDVAIP